MVLMVCGVRAISRQQLKKSLQMLKKQCIGKTGVAEGMFTQKNFDKDKKRYRVFGTVYRKFCRHDQTIKMNNFYYGANDKIVNIEKGQFVEEKEVMCYIACIYQLTNIVKNNKISYEASLKQIDIMYPQDVKEPAKKACEHCKDVCKYFSSISIFELDTESSKVPMNPGVRVF
ncbi:hypothetical protein NE865_01811 [Phthorimaea operculella]|nr:hypothetical protein NE865_01811 [Phthorimaea operculella]